MAAFSHHHRVGSRSSLFNANAGGYADAEHPNGSCNYRDLSIGSNAPVCGCQRFYLNSGSYYRHGQGGGGGEDGGWCFCGHHACFHHAFGLQRAQEPVLNTSRIDFNEEMEHVDDVYNAARAAPGTPAKAPTGLGIRPDSRSGSQSIETRVFRALNDFARNQEDGAVSDTTSKLPSTAAPSVIDEPRLSPNRRIQDRLQQYRSMAPPVHIPHPVPPRPAEDYSATEVATPSIAGTPDFRALASSSNNNTSPGHLPPSRLEPCRTPSEVPTQPLQSLPQEVASNKPPEQVDTTASQDASLRELRDMIRTYGQRIELLESLSFSNIPIEEIQEKFELFDGRILDLEQWRTEQDAEQESPVTRKTKSTKRHRLVSDEEASFASDASFDSNAAAHAETAVLATLAANAETHPRIDALETRVTDLENAALPSFARPWQVQVVLLPWGRDLRGIWFSSTESTEHSLRSATQASEEWSGAQSAPKLSFKSSVAGAWTTESIEAWANEAQEWLSPKACGPSGAVFQRLASRGLVRDITLTSPDPRHILHAIMSAFDILPASQVEVESDVEVLERHQGLREAFIPLRKVRKSSRLRFLSPAEMVTSATWTARFLDSSVFMKVTDGQRRLYVTTPEAYTQPAESVWSWDMIRQLPVPNKEGAEDTGNAVVETCWSYNDNLDRAISIHSSFASHRSQGSVQSGLATFEPGRVLLQPISPTTSSTRPLLRQRTVSFPSSISATGGGQMNSTVHPKRRVASFEPTPTPFALATEDTSPDLSVETVPLKKRRRISASPAPLLGEADRRGGVNFTPRWSREPPSPFTSDAARSQGTAAGYPGGSGGGYGVGSGAWGRRRDGTTPLAYATPHSHSNFAAAAAGGGMDFFFGIGSGGDGDTEAGTEMLDQELGGDEEWEGVGEGEDEVGSASGSGEGSGMSDGEEDDLDDDVM